MTTKKAITNYCKDEPVKVLPIVNFNDCGGKQDCVNICPHNVFEMRPITAADKAKLNLKGKVKTFFFKDKAYVTSPEQWHACGLCVQVCPEKAIHLARSYHS